MKAYCIVYEVIDDLETFEQYRRQVLPTIEAHQGRFIVRGGAFTTLEGEMPYERIAMLEFPSHAAAEGWYHARLPADPAAAHKIGPLPVHPR